MNQQSNLIGPSGPFPPLRRAHTGELQGTRRSLWGTRIAMLLLGVAAPGCASSGVTGRSIEPGPAAEERSDPVFEHPVSLRDVLVSDCFGARSAMPEVSGLSVEAPAGGESTELRVGTAVDVRLRRTEGHDQDRRVEFDVWTTSTTRTRSAHGTQSYDAEAHRRLAFSDTIQDGACLRHFDQVSSVGACTGDFGSGGVQLESALEGATVLFRDGEVVSVEPAVELIELDADALVTRVDLTAFLPVDEVGLGESWEVDPNCLKTVLQPGGGLLLTSSVGVRETTHPIGVDGSVTATLVGPLVDEAHRFRIDLEFDCRREGDLSDSKAECSLANIDYRSVELSETVRGSGWLIWDTEADQVVHLEARLEVERNTEVSAELKPRPGLVTDISSSSLSSDTVLTRVMVTHL